MSNYKIEHKPAFVLAGYGFTIQADFTDFQKLAEEKVSFWAGLQADGRFDKLKKLAKTPLEWSVNEVFQGQPWNYFAVEPSSDVEYASRMIEFPDSDYLVIEGQGEKEGIFDQLSGQAFGQVLPSLTDYAYIGGPNGTFREALADGTYRGEIWIPVVAK